MKKQTLILTALLYLFSLFTSHAQQWQQVSALPAIEMTALFARGDTLFAAGVNRLYYTYDGGASWDSTAVLHPDVDFIEVICCENERLFAGTLTYGVFQSVDGGLNWQADNAGRTGLGAMDISSMAIRGDSLYAGTSGAGVFVKKISTNSTWRACNVGMPWMNIFSLTNQDGKLYAGAGGSAHYALQAQPGHAWAEKPFAVFNGSMNAFLGVVQHNGVLLAAGTLGLYRSTDDGTTWTSYNPGTGILGSARFLTIGNRVIANLAKPAAFSFIQYTDDQGLSWKPFEPALTGSFGHDLVLLNDVLYTARSNGLWRIVATTPVQEPAPDPVAILGQNYPNPFSVTTTFPVTLCQGGQVEFSVFDASGNLVQTLLKGEYAAGIYHVGVQAAGLSPGIYTGRLRTASGVLTRQLICIP